jgi:hypothetical protein
VTYGQEFRMTKKEFLSIMYKALTAKVAKKRKDIFNSLSHSQS